jgi:GR25 family glycosyltransferase involved in LPS biosynthesis
MRRALLTLLLCFAAGADFSYPSPHTWPAWVITLARTPARLQRFKRSSAAFLEFPRLVEFAATDGRSLDVISEGRLSTRARVRTRDVSGRRAHSDLQTLGMAGLYVSHVDVWKAFLDSGEPLGLVLEDDAVVPVGVGARIEAALAGMPPPDTWDVWLVGALALRATGGAPPGLPPGWVTVTDWWGTQAYVVTRRGAAALLAHAYPADAQIDAYMAQMAALGEVVALSRQPLDVDIPQFAWYTLGGTTVQCVEKRACPFPPHTHTTSSHLMHPPPRTHPSPPLQTCRQYQIWCDTCDLRKDFSLEEEESWLRNMGLAFGAVSGAALVALWPLLLAYKKRCALRGCWRRANPRST